MIKDLLSSNATTYITLSYEQLEIYSTNLIIKVLAECKVEESDRLLTLDEILAILKVSKPTLWRWEKQNYLVPTRVGSKVFYKQSDIKKIMEG